MSKNKTWRIPIRPDGPTKEDKAAAKKNDCDGIEMHSRVAHDSQCHVHTSEAAESGSTPKPKSSPKPKPKSKPKSTSKKKKR